jgi:hypothetical protein
MPTGSDKPFRVAGLVTLGRRVDTDAPCRMPFTAFRRGVAIRGPIGSGKTTLMRRFLARFGLQHNVVHLDFSGTGDYFLRTRMAILIALLATLGRLAPVGRTLARLLLRRHAFAVLHDGDAPMPLRIGLLKQRLLAIGERESLTQVVDRVMNVLEAKLNTQDPQIRVRFRRVCRAVLTVLVAAERPISEALELLDNRLYAAFVFRRIEERIFSPFDAEALAFQLAELRRILALFNPSDPRTRRVFDDETGSTRNSLADFAPGTVLGRFFGGTETFNPELVAFGRQSLSVSTTIADPTLRAQCFQALHGLFHPLFVSRQRSSRTFVPVTFASDEIFWMPHRMGEVMALSRNLDVSYMLAYQNKAQWKDIGLETMPDQLGSLTQMEVSMRPSTRQEAEEEVLHSTWLRPGEWVQRFLAASQTRGRSIGHSLLSSWSDTFTEGESHTRGESESDGVSETEGSGWSQSASAGSQAGWNDARAHAKGLQFRDGAVAGASASDSESAARSGSTSESEQRGTSGQRTTGRTRTHGRSSSDSRSTTKGHSQGGSEGHTESDSTSASLAEVLNIVSCGEQLFCAAQAALRRPRGEAHVLYDGQGQVIRMLPPVEFPSHLFGVPVLEQFREAQERYFESQATPRDAFDPRALLAGIPAAKAPHAAPSTVPDETPSFTPGASQPAPTIPKPPIARGRSDRHKR